MIVLKLPQAPYSYDPARIPSVEYYKQCDRADLCLSVYVIYYQIFSSLSSKGIFENNQCRSIHSGDVYRCPCVVTLVCDIIK